MSYKFSIYVKFALLAVLFLGSSAFFVSRAHGATIIATCIGQWESKPYWTATTDNLYLWRSNTDRWSGPRAHTGAYRNPNAYEYEDSGLGSDRETRYQLRNPSSNTVRVYSDAWACGLPPGPELQVTCAPDRSWVRLDWNIVPGQKLNLARRSLANGSWEQPDKMREFGPLPYVNHPNLLPEVAGCYINSWIDYNPPTGYSRQCQLF